MLVFWAHLVYTERTLVKADFADSGRAELSELQPASAGTATQGHIGSE